MPGPGSVACPKPEKRSTTKGRKDRAEAKVAKAVRAEVARRDGHCRLFKYVRDAVQLFGLCSGESHWAHLGDHRRFKTRGLPASERHTSAGSLMLCERHHLGTDGYDRGGFEIEARTARGADGPLTFSARNGGAYTEPDRARQPEETPA